ncbi:lipopolysaccharide biosynthesis protein [Pseudoduganella umbonata]|uniref:Lipopolysaccharide biosynthesis protein n=1 Tax=Pseudoduganella umbonata TaxID=864828 RepID=A0A4P8HNS7_9BURK|nr:lipopolysaccharide biosynthesis protein [Pseudoduganella umbonata]MBB3220078.1 O-antigen/teichoic acid export membrane protein [Pseudoduganella umbonata]QCP10080.1 lipopolysaccharide biosynthesis protein [Pseudoduganella umbonata]
MTVCFSKASARRSLLVSFGERYTLLLFGVAGTMIIARILPPSEIGIFSIGAVLVGLAQVLRDFGVGQYVVASKTLTPDQLRAVLGVSVCSAWTLAGLVALLSGMTADFYDEPRLRDVMRLLALNFVLLPFTALTLSYLRRQLRVSGIYIINTTHSLVQLVSTVWLAACGYGCLSLAWGTVAAAVAGLLVSLPLRPADLPWRPSLQGARAVIGFGFYATGGNLVDEAGVAAPDLIIGKLLDAEAVATFGKAQALLNLFSQAVTSAVSPVILPMFARQARDGQDFRTSYLLTVSCMTAVAWPFFALLGTLALPTVNFVYGPQWDGAAPLIRIMCCSSALYSMFIMARYLFIATGHVREQARLDTLSVAFRVALLLPAALFGLYWVALAVAGSVVIRSWLTWGYLSRLAEINAADLLRAVRQSAALTLLTTLAPIGALFMMKSGPVQLMVASICAVSLWLVGVVIFRHPLAEELELAWRKVARRNAT